MMPFGRLAYSPITQRPRLALPGGAPGDLDHHQRRGMESARTLAAHRSYFAGRRFTDTGYPELGVARVRKPRWLLADAGGHRPLQAPGRACDQRLGDPDLRADRACGSGSRMGVHRSRLLAEEHAEGRRRAGRDCENHRDHPRLHRPGPARMARSGPDRNVGDAGHPGGRRVRVRVRLGARRSACHAEHPVRVRSLASRTRRSATTSR